MIRSARVEDLPRLSEIAFAAKAHWGYPQEWLELWRPELEFTRESLSSCDVRCLESGSEIVAVCSVSSDGEVAEVEGLWVLPACMGRGFGRKLMEDAVDRARARGIQALDIASDPHAEAFYLRLGAERVGSVPSRPAGRLLPKLRLALR